MDILDRIKAIITTEGITVASFARKIGMGDQVIRNIVVQRRNNPSFEVLYKIIEAYPMISAEWLLTGRGAMKKEQFNIPENNAETTVELITYLREKDVRIEQLIQENMSLKA